MKGKICLITGANTGIGKATAIGLAKQGAEIIIACRSGEKAKRAVTEIIEQSGNTNIDYMLVDLSSQESIRNFVKKFQARYAKLDVLINNAGVFFSDLRYSVDNIEMQFATNHLAYFLLTNLLLDNLKAAKDARIVNVASNSHYRGIIHFDDLNQTKNYKALKTYEQAKLANVLFTYELARKLQGTGITVNALHPGVVGTDIAQKNAKGIYNWYWTLAKPFMITTEQGAATSVYLASSDEVKGLTGKYFVKCKEVKSSNRSYNESDAKKLWEISAALTKL